MASIAVFMALGLGTAWALEANSVKSKHIVDGSLNDQDVGQATFVDFDANIGTLQAFDCNTDPITGINAQGDHLLLTPNEADSSPVLNYQIEYHPNDGSAELTTCNPFNFVVDDGTTHFNLLVFDAQ